MTPPAWLAPSSFAVAPDLKKIAVAGADPWIASPDGSDAQVLLPGAGVHAIAW